LPGPSIAELPAPVVQNDQALHPDRHGARLHAEQLAVPPLELTRHDLGLPPGCWVAVRVHLTLDREGRPIEVCSEAPEALRREDGRWIRDPALQQALPGSPRLRKLGH